MLDAVLAWCLTYLLHSTVLSVLALAVAPWLRQPGLRAFVLRAGLFGALATATLASALPAPEVARVWGTSRGAGSAAIASPVAAVHGDEVTGATSARIAPTGSRGPRRVDPAVLMLAAMGAVSLAGVAALVLRRRRWIASLGRVPLEDPAAGAELLSLARREGVRLSRSGALDGPVALSNREVCLPERAWEVHSRAERSALLAHEAAHLVRRDPMLFLAGHLVERIAFLQPLHRIVRARAQVASELAADAWAIERTGDSVGYARALHGFAARLHAQRPAPASVAGAFPSRPPLAERVALALDGSAGTPGRRERWGTVTATGALLIAVACAAPRIEAGASSEGAAPALARHAQPGAMQGDELVVEIDEASRAVAYGDAGARALGTYVLTDRAGRESLQEALARAAGPAVITSASARYGGIELSEQTLRIRAERTTPFRDVQWVMELCGGADLRLWDLQFEVPGGGAKYTYALPGDRSGGPQSGTRRNFDLRVDSEPTGYVLTETEGDPLVPVEIEEGAEHEDSKVATDPFETTDRGVLVRELSVRLAEAPGSSVSIDPRRGATYAEILTLLDEVIGAGAVDVMFKGTYER